MKKVLLCGIMLMVGVSAQERIVIPKPIPGAASYTVDEILFSWGTRPNSCIITIHLIPDSKEVVEKQQVYRGAQACNMLRELNTADFRKVSLQRRVMTQLCNDKVFECTVDGTPEPQEIQKRK